MSSASVFSLGNTLAMLSWVYLIGFGRWTPTMFKWVRIGIPAVLSIGYVVALALAMPIEGGFGNIEQVRLLFQNDWALTAGWIHYLAFDFFVGCWILSKAKEAQISHWLVAPCMVATFIIGPAGYLLFLAIRKVSVAKN
jgi:hypothetical protein